MIYIQYYLIIGIFFAALNDIFIIDGLMRNEHSKMLLIDKIICRVAIVGIMTIGWLPIMIYMLFFWKGNEWEQ